MLIVIRLSQKSNLETIQITQGYLPDLGIVQPKVYR